MVERLEERAVGRGDVVFHRERPSHYPGVVVVVDGRLAWVRFPDTSQADAIVPLSALQLATDAEVRDGYSRLFTLDASRAVRGKL